MDRRFKRFERGISSLRERLGLAGEEMTVSGHSRDFVLRVVQPGLIGLMDGSVSTLAPLFATAFATGNPRIAFSGGPGGRCGGGHQHGLFRGSL